MKKNVGNVDKIARLVVAAVLGVLIGMGTLTGTVAVIAGVMAGIFAVTAFAGTCLLYLPFGLSTCKVDSQTS